MSRVDLEIRRGNDVRIYIPVTRDDVAVNITDATFALYCKRWLSDIETALESTDFEILDGLGGEAIINIGYADTLVFTDTIDLNYEIDMTESTGRVTTVAYGKLTVLMDVA